MYHIAWGVAMHPEGVYIMNSKDYIPSNDGQFLEWAENLYTYVLTHFSGWAIPSPQATLETPLGTFETAFSKLSDPNYGKVGVLPV
jgi:hypothetical protein